MELKKALKAVEAAVKHAETMPLPIVAAVVDAGGNLVALQRMEGALLASIDIAVNKAYTAVAVKIATNDLAEVAQPGQSLYGIHTTNNGKIVIFGGGFPLTENGEIVGGFGVSGGSVEQDMEIAQAGLAAW